MHFLTLKSLVHNSLFFFLLPSFILFCCIFQAIIQGLKESGVFSSIIASAPTILSKDKFLASIESSNSSRAAASESLPSRKISRRKESYTTSRKALGTIDTEAAVPPLPPPGMDDDSMFDA
ncbi:hypothetical protein U1Q18_022734 [Sarracenia purpurea var. burkii]